MFDFFSQQKRAFRQQRFTFLRKHYECVVSWSSNPRTASIVQPFITATIYSGNALRDERLLNLLRSIPGYVCVAFEEDDLGWRLEVSVNPSRIRDCEVLEMEVGKRLDAYVAQLV